MVKQLQPCFRNLRQGARMIIHVLIMMRYPSKFSSTPEGDAAAVVVDGGGGDDGE